MKIMLINHNVPVLLLFTIYPMAFAGMSEQCFDCWHNILSRNIMITSIHNFNNRTSHLFKI